MKAKLLSAAVAVVILTVPPVLSGQSRGERGGQRGTPPNGPDVRSGGRQSQPQRGPAGNRRGSAVPEPTVPGASTPATTPTRKPGEVSTPDQGYVLMPESAPAGVAYPAPIPSDPLELGYWELYDRKQPVTLSGSVTRVDWSNPNAYIYIAALGGEWAVESSFIQFRQASVSPAVRVNETITVMGFLPIDTANNNLPAKKLPALASYLKLSRVIRASEITTVHGQKLQMGRPPSEAEMAQRLKCSPFGC